MATLGAPIYVSLRISADINRDISRAMKGASGSARRQAQTIGQAFTEGFNRGTGLDPFRRVSNALRSVRPNAEAARASFVSLMRTGNTLGTALMGILASISSLIGGLFSLGGAAVGAASMLGVLGNSFFALGAAMIVARLALGGIGGALRRLNQQTTQSAVASSQAALQQVRDAQARATAARRIEDAERSLAKIIARNRELIVNANNQVRDSQIALNKALREGKEEIQQIGFDAEEAALAERRASIELENARQALARTQDLAPNDSRRKEAEQAYLEAELNYRKAKDLSADLNAEQERLSKTGASGLAGVIAARKRLAEAEREKADAVRKAAEDEADALRDLEETRNNASVVDQKIDLGAIGGGGGPDPFEGLNQAQIDFVMFLQSLKPQIDELKRLAAEAFLPKLQEAIQMLSDKLYPTIANGVTIIGNAMGNAAISLASVITEGQNIEKLNTLFEKSGPLIETMARVFGHVYDILLSIFVELAPDAQGFFDTLDAGFGQFADYLNSEEGKKELKQFFDDARFTAGLFGDVLGNVFGGIGALIMANIGPGTGGETLLQWLKDATTPPEDSDKLKQYFNDVADNVVKILDAIAPVVEKFKELAADESVGTMWDNLGKGADNLANIMQKMVDAGPSLGDLIATVTEIVDAFTDTEAIKIFFDTLNGVATTIKDWVKDPANKGFIDFLGRVAGWFSAIGLVIGTLSFGLSVVFGIFGQVFGAISKVIGIVKPFFALVAANPIVGLITVIGLLIAYLVDWFTTTEQGKAVWENIMRVLSDIWNTILTVAETVWTAITDFFTATGEGMSKFFEDTWNAISGFFDAAFTWIDTYVIKPFAAALDWLGTAFQNVGTWFGDVWTNIQKFFNDAWVWIDTYIIKPMALAFEATGAAFDALGLFFSTTWDLVMDAFEAAWNWIDTYIFIPMTRAFDAVGVAFDTTGVFIGTVWETMKNAINTVWNWIDTWIFAPIRNAVGLVQTAFENSGTGAAVAWEGLQTALETVWNWIDTWIFNPLETAVAAIQTAFENTVAGIKTAWNGLYSLVRVPVNAIIDFAYNNGIMPFWNGIAGAFGLNDMKLSKVALLPEKSFATGGVLPGYTPGRDVHRFYSPTGGILNLSGGEAIMRPEWVRMVGGPEGVERLNRAARGGGSSSGYGTRSGGERNFFMGGVFDFLGDTWENVTGFVSTVATITTDFLTDPMAAVDKHIVQGIINPIKDSLGGSALVDVLFGIPGAIGKGIGKLVADTMGFSEETKRQQGGPGVGMGWQGMWSTLSRVFPWATLNDAQRPAGTQTAAGGTSFHSLGRAIDTTASMEIFNWIKRVFPNSAELIYSPAGGRQLRNGREYMWGNPVRDMHFDHVHWALAKGGTVMPTPGGTIARIAEAGRAERVEPLDPNGLSDRDKAIMDRYMGNPTGSPININVYAQPNQDVNELAEIVSRKVSFNMRKGAVR